MSDSREYRGRKLVEEDIVTVDELADPQSPARQALGELGGGGGGGIAEYDETGETQYMLGDIVLRFGALHKSKIDGHYMPPPNAIYWDFVGMMQGYGTTANRPTSTYNGQQYFDATLGKPIWYKNGTGWIDSAGTAV